MYSLLIDTHDTNINLVLFKDGKSIKIIKKASLMSHSIYVMPLIKEMINDEKIEKKDIKEIIVVNGPGSFTGVRIGITIAKTWALCMKTKLKVISSFDILTYSFAHDSIIFGIPDPKGYYVARYDSNNLLLEDYKYYTKMECSEFIDNIVLENSVKIDYDKVYKYASGLQDLNPHLAKPLYIKKIGVSND